MKNFCRILVELGGKKGVNLYVDLLEYYNCLFKHLKLMNSCTVLFISGVLKIAKDLQDNSSVFYLFL